MKLSKKTGISLIVLIITIIVVIILAAVVILTLSKNNPINSSKEATFREDIYNFKTELELYKAKASGNGADVTKLYANKDSDPSITDVISSMSKKYINKLEVREGKLAYVGKDKTEYLLAREINLLPEDELLDDDILTELKPFITEWTVEAGDSITLPIKGKCNFIVDYGDGSDKYSVTSATDEDRIHTYENAGIYTITITGRCENISISDNRLTKLVQWGVLSDGLTANYYSFANSTNLSGTIPSPSLNTFKKVSDVSSLFHGCSKLTGNIPKDLFYGANKIENFGITWGMGAFMNCTGLTGEIPSTLFRDCINAKNFSFTFYGCTGLTGNLSSDLFKNCTKTTRFSGSHWNNTGGGIFEGCSGLTSVSDYLFSSCTEATDFTAVFKGCSGLSCEIPEHIFANCTKANDFAYVFSGCKNIKGKISSNLFKDCMEVTTFVYAFNGCESIQKVEDVFKNHDKVTSFAIVFNDCKQLEEVSGDIFKGCTNVENFASSFANCQKLEVIPAGIFDDCPNVKYFEGVFQCTGIKEVPKDLFRYNTEVLRFGIDGEWRGVFLGCSKLELVPEDLFKYNTKATHFEVCFFGCSNLSNIVNLEYNVNIKTTRKMFFGCNKMTGTAYPIWNNPNITSYTWCFYSCTKLSNYSDIPSNWK